MAWDYRSKEMQIFTNMSSQSPSALGPVRSQSAAELDEIFGCQRGQRSELQVYRTANAAFGEQTPSYSRSHRVGQPSRARFAISVPAPCPVGGGCGTRRVTA
jgi:hypothetical protein